MDEVEALARIKAALVRLRGQWIALTSTEIQEAIRFWEARAVCSSTMLSSFRTRPSAVWSNWKSSA